MHGLCCMKRGMHGMKRFFSMVAARLQVESFDCFIRRFLVQHSFAIGDMF